MLRAWHYIIIVLRNILNTFFYYIIDFSLYKMNIKFQVIILNTCY